MVTWVTLPVFSTLMWSLSLLKTTRWLGCWCHKLQPPVQWENKRNTWTMSLNNRTTLVWVPTYFEAEGKEKADEIAWKSSLVVTYEPRPFTVKEWWVQSLDISGLMGTWRSWGSRWLPGVVAHQSSRQNYTCYGNVSSSSNGGCILETMS